MNVQKSHKQKILRSEIDIHSEQMPKRRRGRSHRRTGQQQAEMGQEQIVREKEGPTGAVPVRRPYAWVCLSLQAPWIQGSARPTETGWQFPGCTSTTRTTLAGSEQGEKEQPSTEAVNMGLQGPGWKSGTTDNALI